jgi:hypothetical protein
VHVMCTRFLSSECRIGVLHHVCHWKIRGCWTNAVHKLRSRDISVKHWFFKLRELRRGYLLNGGGDELLRLCCRNISNKCGRIKLSKLSRRNFCRHEWSN